MRKAVRHWPGKQPENLVPDSSSDEEEEFSVDQNVSNEEQVDFEQEKHVDFEQEQQCTTAVGISFTAANDQEASSSEDEEGMQKQRELLRLRALKLRQEESEEEFEEGNVSQVGQDMIGFKPIAMQQEKGLQARETQLNSHGKVQTEEEESSSEEEESSSEEEESSSEEEQVMLKPVFIPKLHRETVLEKERIEQELAQAETKRKEQNDERKKESQDLASQVIKNSLKAVKEDIDDVPDIDDTDGLNEEEEYAAWKLRELLRMKRDRIEQAQRDQEIMDIERRRNMTDAEIIAEDSKDKPQQERSKIKFLQKYYHKGAFFADEEILARDYNEPTLEDKVDKSSLPAVMQVKNFGKMSRTKWTHLTNEDTSAMDAGWNAKTDVNKRIISKMGGYKEGQRKKHKV